MVGAFPGGNSAPTLVSARLRDIAGTLQNHIPSPPEAAQRGYGEQFEFIVDQDIPGKGNQ